MRQPPKKRRSPAGGRGGRHESNNPPAVYDPLSATATVPVFGIHKRPRRVAHKEFNGLINGSCLHGQVVR